jgi:hypothetical protein
VVASPDQSGPGDGRLLLATVRAVAAQCEPRPLVTSIRDEALILWPEAPQADTPMAAAEHIRRAVNRLADGGTVTVVVGHRSDRAEDARAAVGTARGALELARLHGADRVVTLPDLGGYGLILQINEPPEIVRFANNILTPLRKYNERSWCPPCVRTWSRE